MIARLFKKGKSVDIYLLEVDEADNSSEVREFFDSNANNPDFSGIIRGFHLEIEHIANNGFCLTSEMFDSWRDKKTGEIFCELKKGRHRIGCFKYNINGQQLLLITHFIKKKQLEKREYDRAIKIKREFDSQQRWEN